MKEKHIHTHVIKTIFNAGMGTVYFNILSNVKLGKTNIQNCMWVETVKLPGVLFVVIAHLKSLM